MLIAGNFTTVGGQTRHYIARVDGTTGLVDSFNPNADAYVNAIALQTDGKILVGGGFTNIGGQSRNSIARVDPITGSADLFDPNASGFPTGIVDSIVVQADGKILVGGSFGSIGGQVRNDLARLDPATGLADSFDPHVIGSNSIIDSILPQPDGRILAGGNFTSIGGQTRRRIGRVDPMTGLADSFNPNVSNGLFVYSLAVQADGKVLAGGLFSTVGGLTRNDFARVDPATGAPDSFDPNPNGVVRSLAVQPDGKILVGGGFTNIGARNRNNLALLNPDCPLSTPSPTPPATPTPSPWGCAWSMAAPYPTPVTGVAVASLGGKLYAFGGYSPAGRINNAYQFDGTTWSPIASLPVALGGAAAVTDGIYIYILGGGLDLPMTTNTVYRYEPIANSYTVMAPFAHAVVYPVAQFLGGKIYKFCGDIEPGFASITLEIYDIATNTWTTGASYPLVVNAMTGFVHGNFIYGVGGYEFNVGLTRKTYRYDPATNTWNDAAIADLPSERDSAAAVSYNNGGVVAGGRVGINATFSSSVIVWDPTSNIWSDLPNMLGERLNMRGGVLNGSLYMVGGSSTSSATNDNQKLTCVPGPSPSPSQSATSPPSTPTPSPTPAPATPTPSVAPPTLGNISTRLRVEMGDNVLIGGFIVTGTQPKKVIVRAIGPSLASFFPDALADPVLELRDSSGGLIRSNDNWRSNQEAEIIATGIPPSNDLESAIVATLPASSSAYTAIVRGVNNGTGIGVVEAYDLDRTVDSKLANISTRGFVQTGDNVLIGGLIVLGQNPLRVIVRAIGPSLPAPGALIDPTLELHDGNGALIASNDNWRSDQEAEIIATGIPPTNDLESAIVRNLMPGNYTAIVRGVNGGTGVALVEAYGLN